jgi:hypothetical protein
MQVYSHQIDAPYVPVRIDLALPILDIPGCVEAHVDSDLSSALTSNDPDGVRIFCDAHMPSFNAMDYTPELLTFSRKPLIPRMLPPKQDQQQPSAKQVTPKPPVTPPASAPPASDEMEIAERVVQCLDGEHYVNGRCELIPGVPISVKALVETYIPPVPAITSTAVIAVVATTSALLAKPVSDILLKIIKPTVKKVIKKIKKMLGKKIKVESLRERRHQQRMRNRAIRAVRDLLRKN